MPHGAQAYFEERARFERRVSTFMVGIALAFLGLMALWISVPELRHTLDDPRRFGFEGPDQFVRRIVLESQGPAYSQAPIALEAVKAEAQKGGRPAETESRRPDAVPTTRRIGLGPGSAEEDFLARARSLFPQSLVVQSEDLVIERLVRPSYPAEAQEKNIEGTVAVVAKLDTLGGITGVEVVGGSGEPLLEGAVTAAVMQCLFRPYRVEGEAKEIAVLFRFRFQFSN